MKPYNPQNQTNAVAVKTIWQKLFGTHESKYAQLVSSQNNALIEKNKVTKELQPLASGRKNGAVVTIGLIVFAGIFDMVFWKDMFKEISNNETIQRSVALTLAALVALVGTVIGKNLAERQLRKNQEDDYTPEQLAVFHRNTRHEYAKPLMAVMAIVLALIPAVRWMTLNNEVLEEQSKVMATLTFTALSYFVIACVIGIEWYYHCPWQVAIDKAENNYKTACADREKENKVIMALGEELLVLDAEQDKPFRNWLAQDDFKLIVVSHSFKGNSPKYGGPKKDHPDDEQFNQVV